MNEEAKEIVSQLAEYGIEAIENEIDRTEEGSAFCARIQNILKGTDIATKMAVNLIVKEVGAIKFQQFMNKEFFKREKNM